MAYDLCAQRSGFCGEVHRRQPGLSSHFKLSTPAGNSGSVAGSSARITGPDATPMLGHRSPPAPTPCGSADAPSQGRLWQHRHHQDGRDGDLHKLRHGSVSPVTGAGAECAPNDTVSLQVPSGCECQPLAAVFGLGQRLVRRYFDHRQGSRVSIWRIGWSAMRLRTSAR